MVINISKFIVKYLLDVPAACRPFVSDNWNWNKAMELIIALITPAHDQLFWGNFCHSVFVMIFSTMNVAADFKGDKILKH